MLNVVTRPYFIAALISLFISFLCYLHTDIINPDAICYLLSAQMIGENGLKQAMQLCGQAQWPFYSALIYFFAKMTTLSFTHVAYGLNAIFDAISVIFFMLIVQRLGGSKRTIGFAAFIILAAHQFNAVRDYIIRDHGYWAFYLMSIFLFIDYLQKPRWGIACLWAFSLMMAILFRLEGIFFVAILPFVAFFQSQSQFKERIKQFLSLNSLLILLGIIICCLLWWDKSQLVHFGRLQEVSWQIQKGYVLLATHVHDLQTSLATQVLSANSQHEINLVTILLLLSWYGVSVINNVSFIYSALIIYGWVRQIRAWKNPARAVLFGYLLVNVMITFVFLLEALFLSKRYLIGLSLVLMLYVPFVLNDLSLRWSNKRYRLALIVISMIIFVSGMWGVFNVNHKKSYIRQAGEWAAENIPKQAKLYVNDYQLMYYSQHFAYDLFARFTAMSKVQVWQKNKWRQYDYLMVRVDHDKDDEQKIAKSLSIQPIKTFENARHDRVVIYKGEKFWK